MPDPEWSQCTGFLRSVQGALVFRYRDFSWVDPLDNLIAFLLGTKRVGERFQAALS